ncbi:MAG: DUF5103 domain-containing protein [Bacteroidales bacterium]|nr:DUF5103 domain-containing protein [Bacteroidales bacterium]
MIKYNILFCILFILINVNLLFSQKDITDSLTDYYQQNYLRYDNHIYKENIKTVLLHRDGWELSYPVIMLNSEDKLKFSFDDLDADIKDYYYTLLHCNSDWTPSNLTTFDYIDGFIKNKIPDYENSFNTLIRYTHYNLILPNDDFWFKLSGNYLLKIFEDYDEENPVITRRLFVVQQEVGIKVSVKQPVMIEKRNNSHEIDFSIEYQQNQILNPYRDIKVVIAQNNRWDNAIDDLEPLFVKDDILIYDYDQNNLFKAGSEFRHFDIKSLRYLTDKVNDIKFISPDYHVKLFTDEKRSFKRYFFDQDLNGKYLIKVQERNNAETEAEYVYVYFQLNMEFPLIHGNLYVFGGLSDWRCEKNNLMTYNYENKCYELKMLLKQGYYNYEYVYLEDGILNIDNNYIEGSHYETENDYLIFIYHRDLSLNYDKLVGFQIVNSVINK